MDMAVLPHHQRRGIGDAILSALLTAISDAAPTEAFVHLLADAPGLRGHERHGFVPTAPEGIEMSLKL